MRDIIPHVFAEVSDRVHRRDESLFVAGYIRVQRLKMLHDGPLGLLCDCFRCRSEILEINLDRLRA